MPYKTAHFYLLALIPITFIAFWPSYFGVLSSAPLAHHLHGVTGTLWILLLALQNWSIHSGRRELHKLSGKSLFILLPVMTAAFAMVTLNGAQTFAKGHIFYDMFGKALLTADVLLTFVTPALVMLALMHRHQAAIHGALMHSTIIGLLPPILARLFAGFMPGMTIRGDDTLYRFEYCLQLSMAVSLAICIYLYWRNKQNGWPWLLAGIITIVIYTLYATLGQSQLWSDASIYMSAFNMTEAFLFGLVIGIVACTLGWFNGPAKTQMKSA